VYNPKVENKPTIAKEMYLMGCPLRPNDVRPATGFVRSFSAQFHAPRVERLRRQSAIVCKQQGGLVSA
jgi:hypothetical protein